MKLTKNFTLSELTKTSYKVENKPTDKQIEKMNYLCTYLFQPIRDRWGVVIATSVFRSKELNDLVGGGKDSQHLKGEAGDFVTEDLWECFKWCVRNLKFGSCIYETKGDRVWIHISLPRLNKGNQQALIYKDGNYTVYES